MLERVSHLKNNSLGLKFSLVFLKGAVANSEMHMIQGACLYNPGLRLSPASRPLMGIKVLG
jgi:hypothetical protein